MSVLVDNNTRVVVQGITGKEGSFHARACRDYGTKVVAGVTPGKGGQKMDNIPVFNKLQTIEGVGEIFIGGYRERNVRVWFDAPRLEAHALTVLDVIGAIQREHLEVPAGRIETPEREMNVRAAGEALDLAAFRALVVAFREGTPVRLQDAAVVEDGLEDRRRLARSNGEPSIGFGIRKLRGANAVEVGERARLKLEQLWADLPEGVNLGVRFDATQFVKHAINETLLTLLLAALLTGLVCWLFLGSWSTTVNVLLAIPTSILGTIVVNLSKAVSYGRSADERFLGLLTVVAHEVFHAVLSVYKAGSPDWRQYYQSYRSVFDQLLDLAQNEGIAYYMNLVQQSRGVLPSDWNTRVGNAFGAFNRAAEEMLHPGTPPARAYDLLQRSNTSGHWENYGAITGMIVARQIDRTLGRAALARTLTTGPYAFFSIYAELARQDDSLPRLSSRLLEEISRLRP